jgi:hypothetical protein
MEASMTPEIEADLRTTVASLRVKASCMELLLLAVLPTLEHHQKEAIRERLDATEDGEVLPSRLVDRSEVERETALWIQTMREALEE